jgi:hypothetical protein
MHARVRTPHHLLLPVMSMLARAAHLHVTPRHRVLYVLHGPGADANNALTPADKAALDGMSMEQVVAAIKATGGAAFSSGRSAYRGVSWHKGCGRWRAAIRLPGGKLKRHLYGSELEAAHQYDAWARAAGK